MRHAREPWFLPYFRITLAAAGGWPADSKVTDAQVCVFPLANLSPNGAQQEHQKPLSDAVRQEFEAVGFKILPDELWTAEAARLKLAPDPGDGSVPGSRPGSEGRRGHGGLRFLLDGEGPDPCVPAVL